MKEYGPTLLVLIISYYRDSAIVAKNKEKLSALEKKFLENKASVEEKYSGKSDSDVIDSNIKPSP